MQRRWWIAIVAGVGIVLAVLLMPRPDTGGDIPPADPTNRDPLNFDGPAAVPPGAVTSPGAKIPPPADPDRVVQGTRPELAAIREARNRPEVVYAGKVMGPWSAMRYVLLKDGSPEARALGDEINTEVMAELRKIRTADDPNAIWPVVEPKMAGLADKISASPWGSDETIAKSLERYRSILQEFHDAQAGKAPAPTDAEPAPGEE